MFYLGIALITGPHKMAMRAYEPLAFVRILAAVLLFSLQAVVLKAYCIYCLGTEVIALLMWAGSLLVTSSGAKVQL